MNQNRSISLFARLGATKSIGWSSPGYTLAEMMVIVGILSILAVISLSVTLKELTQAEARAVAQDISQWMEAVRRNATRGAGCNVTITNTLNANSQTNIAESAVFSSPSISISNQCLSSTPLKLQSANSTTRTFRVQASPTTSFTFTSRGTIFNSSSANGDFTQDLQITVNAVSSGVVQPPMYCVRIRPPMGEIDVITNDSATSGRCQ